MDLPGLLALATDAATNGSMPGSGCPWPGWMPTWSRGRTRSFSGVWRRGRRRSWRPNSEKRAGLQPGRHSLEHLRQFLFSPEPQPYRENDGRFEFFSAPGEGLEAVEIARRIIRLAREGIAFDQVAILLRNPDRYQPMIEDALRRARIPAWFSRGTARPHPSGRAFLALLLCAGERLSASRFAEYLSLGQVPETPGARSGWRPRTNYSGPWITS